MFQKRLQFFRSLLYLNDLFWAAGCWLFAYFVRFHLPVFPVTKGDPGVGLYIGLLWVVVGTFAIVLPAMDSYRQPWAGWTKWIWPVLRSTALGILVAIAITYLIRPYEFSRLVFMHFAVFYPVAVLISRPLLKVVWRYTLPRQRRGDGVLIVGVEDLGRMVAAKINEQPILGLKTVGFLSKDPDKVGQNVDGMPVLGQYFQIRQILSRYPIQQVIIALPLSAHDRIHEILNNISDEMVDIKIVPDLYRYMSLQGALEVFEGIPIIGLRAGPLEGWGRVLKRIVDILGSLAGLCILGPVMLAVAIGVKMSSPGPVFFRQQRMGIDGKVFHMLKFRSMRNDAEKECGPVWACENDPRTTRFGSFLRRTSLDEIPQFFNVMRGEMSLVGPRPERPELIMEFRQKFPGYMLRHTMKAGITGWAQVNGWRGNTSLERRLQHDLYYIENWSLGFDLKILFMTVLRGFVHPNAY